MILVLGRPGLDEQGELGRTSGRVALAAAESGVPVELVGSVGDDPDGDDVAIALSRAGIGHAALLRDPAGTTPRAGRPAGPLPRLDAGDVELGLQYLPECRVLVITEPLEPDAVLAARELAAYHGAALIVVVEPGEEPPTGLMREATVLQKPEQDDGAFNALVGRYASLLERGRPADEAWKTAVADTGWEQVAE